MQHGNMNILMKVHNPSNAILISEDGVEIQNNTSTSTSDPAPVSVPTPDFPFTEFPSTEVVIQSQIDSSSISDKEVEVASERKQQFFEQSLQQTWIHHWNPCKTESHYEEIREIGDLNVSAKHTQSTRDPTTISIPGNSNFRKSTPGTKADNPYSITSRNKCVFCYRNWIQVYHAYWWSSPNGPTRFAFRWLPIEEFQFSSKKGRRSERWSIPADPEDPQPTPASPMWSSKAQFFT